MGKKILITGGSGLVGSKIAELLRKNYTVFTPTHQELDITKPIVLQNVPDVIIHVAALLDLNVAEGQRGDKQGEYWQVNVEGTKNIAQAAKSAGSFFIHVSTGSVFRGTEKDSGPYKETHPVTPLQNISWYGWTKSQAERYVDGAILRIAHPIKPHNDIDYVHKLLSLHAKGTLFPLFTDQQIQLTWIDDIAEATQKIIDGKMHGIFHITNPDWVTPYDLAWYLSRDISIQKGLVPNSLRHHKYCLLDVSQSQKKLGMRFKTWKEAVDLALTNSYLES